MLFRNVSKSQKGFKEPQKNPSLSHRSDKETLSKTLHGKRMLALIKLARPRRKTLKINDVKKWRDQ